MVYTGESFWRKSADKVWGAQLRQTCLCNERSLLRKTCRIFSGKRLRFCSASSNTLCFALMATKWRVPHAQTPHQDFKLMISVIESSVVERSLPEERLLCLTTVGITKPCANDPTFWKFDFETTGRVAHPEESLIRNTSGVAAKPRRRRQLEIECMMARVKGTL